MTKRILAISIVLVMLLSLLITGCDSFGSKTEEPIPEPTPEPTPTATTEPMEESLPEVTETQTTPEPPEETEDPPPDEPEETRWGPLTADFLDLLASRNYYLKYEMLDVSIGPDGDVTTEPDIYNIINEAARQDDAYAFAMSDPLMEDALVIHMVNKDNKSYSIKHDRKLVYLYEDEKLDASDDKDDLFPVSYMEFIESGVGSVDGVSIPYEDYSITGLESIIRIYMDGAKVAYSMIIYKGESSFVRTNYEISPDVPSYLIEIPPDYTVEVES